MNYKCYYCGNNLMKDGYSFYYSCHNHGEIIVKYTYAPDNSLFVQWLMGNSAIYNTFIGKPVLSEIVDYQYKINMKLDNYFVANNYPTKELFEKHLLKLMIRSVFS